MNDLMSMGFDENASRDALQKNNGNFNAALEFLLGGNVRLVYLYIHLCLLLLQPCSQASLVGLDNVLVLGISQYSFSEAGSSACTVIAVTAAQTLLKQLNDGNNIADVELLSDIVMSGSNLFTEQSLTCHQHLAVDELGPIIKGDLTMIGSFQGILPTDRSFEKMLEDARAVAVPGRYIGIVITKPPETVCVIIPPIDTPSGGIFVLFDSHSRPQWGYDGAYMLTSTSEENVVRHLHKLFPPLDLGPGATDQMQMYNMFEATAFQ